MRQKACSPHANGIFGACAFCARQGRESELRTVRGTVVDKQETPVDSGVVYLKECSHPDITNPFPTRKANSGSVASI